MTAKVSAGQRSCLKRPAPSRFFTVAIFQSRSLNWGPADRASRAAPRALVDAATGPAAASPASGCIVTTSSRSRASAASDGAASSAVRASFLRPQQQAQHAQADENHTQHRTQQNVSQRCRQGHESANSLRSALSCANKGQQALDTEQPRYQGSRTLHAQPTIQNACAVVIHPKYHHQSSSSSKHDFGAASMFSVPVVSRENRSS
mmetsp:Transcript_23318/g.76618  ORF Transcript_23318/g.76618 Transcript_23318/m.76618 type:complete len:205 (+) Transcript_23318:2138-2752(+)